MSLSTFEIQNTFTRIVLNNVLFAEDFWSAYWKKNSLTEKKLEKPMQKDKVPLNNTSKNKYWTNSRN